MHGFVPSPPDPVLTRPCLFFFICLLLLPSFHSFIIHSSHHPSIPSTEQIGVGRREEALQTLVQGMNSRRVRVWSKDHAQIMYLLNQLAVEFRYHLRDVYQQYLRLCIAHNMDSYLELLQNYLQLAVQRCEAARLEAEAANEAKTDKDEELERTPEQLMLSLQLVDTERSTREILAPWVKYTVEVYRTVMDSVYRNVKTHRYYHEVCRSGLDFCRRYERNWEFRRLCDFIRIQQSRLKNPSSDPTDKHRQKVDLNDPQVQTLYLKTRFHQLEVASGMELWQEAYKTIEDIHESLMFFDSEPEPQLMVTYYNKLADIFWASRNFLFHAYSLREFAFMQQQCLPAEGTEEAEEGDATAQARLREVASAVLLATLVVPLSTRYGEEESDLLLLETHDSNQQLAELLGFKKETPTRTRLITEITETIGFMEQVRPEVLRIYELLETEFNPLTLARELQPLIRVVQEIPLLARYTEQLKETAVVRILQQCGTVYDTLQYDKFLRFLPEGLEEERVELLILHAARDYNASVSIDWRNRLLRFGGVAGSHTLREPADGYNPGALTTVIHSSIDDSQIFREQLKVLGLRLQSALDRATTEEPGNRSEVFALIRDGAAEDHAGVPLRLQEIQRRLQDYETRRQDKEKREEELRRELEQQKKIDEYLRLQQESRRREEALLQREREAADLRKKQTLVQALQEKVQDISVGAKAAKKLENIDVTAVDSEELIRLGRQVLEREKVETERLRRETAKMHEYYARALRVEETARIVEQLKQARATEQSRIEEFWSEKETKLRDAHQKALEEKRRLERIVPIQADWSEALISVRRSAYEKARAQQLARLEKQRVKRAEEERARRRAEEERKRAEEEERLRKEEEARLRKEREAEEEREREELLRRQQARMRELEEREEREREERRRREEEEGEAAAAADTEREKQYRRPTFERGTAIPSTGASPRPGAWERRTRTPVSAAAGGGGGGGRGWQRAEREEERAGDAASSSSFHSRGFRRGVGVVGGAGMEEDGGEDRHRGFQRRRPAAAGGDAEEEDSDRHSFRRRRPVQAENGEEGGGERDRPFFRRRAAAAEEGGEAEDGGRPRFQRRAADPGDDHQQQRERPSFFRRGEAIGDRQKPRTSGGGGGFVRSGGFNRRAAGDGGADGPSPQTDSPRKAFGGFARGGDGERERGAAGADHEQEPTQNAAPPSSSRDAGEENEHDDAGGWITVGGERNSRSGQGRRSGGGGRGFRRGGGGGGGFQRRG